MFSRELPVAIATAIVTVAVLLGISFGAFSISDSAGSTPPPSGPPPTTTPSPSATAAPTETAGPSTSATTDPGAPFTFSTAPVTMGDTMVFVQNAASFTAGDQVIFNQGGGNEEHLIISESQHIVQGQAAPQLIDEDFLVFTTPLQFDHAAGEEILNITQATPTLTPPPNPSETPTATPTLGPPCPGAPSPPGGTCPPCPGFERLGVASTCPPTASPTPGELLPTLWGDANCSAEVDPIDSLLTLRNDAGLAANTGDCPALGSEIDVLNASPHIWGDIDCSGEANPVDSLKILRFDAGLSVSQEGLCPAMGGEVTLAIS